MLITLWYPSSPALVSLAIDSTITSGDVSDFVGSYGQVDSFDALSTQYPDDGRSGFVITCLQESVTLDAVNEPTGPGSYELVVPEGYHLGVLPPTSRGFFNGFCISNLWFAQRGLSPVKTWDNVSDAVGAGTAIL